MNINITRHKQRLDNLFTEAAKITDFRMQGEWAKYLCVLSSGYLENSIRIILDSYISTHSTPTIQRLNEPFVSNITNCKIGKITKILEQFDPNWGINFTTEINAKSKIPDEIKDSIDSLVQTRHDIAHGKNVGAGYVRIKAYFEKAEVVVQIINTIVA